jgi:hypothetical protein
MLRAGQRPDIHELPGQLLSGITADVVGPTAYFFGTSVSLRANFSWRHVIGQVLLNIEENRRVVSAPANDCIAFP